MKDPRLSRLMDPYLDGQLTGPERAELEDLLRRSASARAQFWHEVRLHAQLREVEYPEETPRPVPARPRGGWRLAVAACVGLALGGALWAWRSPTAPAEPTTAAVAVLTRAVDVQWDGNAHSVGTALAPGWLRLRSGLAQVEFFNGARVVLEGPVELQLVSAGKAFCARGRLSAEVPEQARGFTIDTPQVNVVDRGTAFGLDVTGEAAEVHVFKGEVVAGQRSLKEGEAVAVSGNGRQRMMAATPVAFPSVAELERRSAEAQVRQLAAWRDAAQRWEADPSLLLRFDFEDLTRNGTVVGCERTEGRWPGKGALGFHRVGDRVRIHVPGLHPSISMAAWVRVDALDRPYHSLVMSQGYGEGALHWQINQKGVVHVGVGGAGKEAAHDYGTATVFTPDRFGRWTHLAVVIDTVSGRVTHYADGEPVSRHALRSSAPLQPGLADIGNWSVGTHSTIYPVRHFSGRMDEFVVFGRALTDADIGALYHAGRPRPEPSA